jgi:hypothetical protein
MRVASREGAGVAADSRGKSSTRGVYLPAARADLVTAQGGGGTLVDLDVSSYMGS